MSKVSKLKQEAYQAGKKRDWDKVIVLYERILELEKNNPSLINELGDTYLKRGDVKRAIALFIDAAEKYRQTGLLNNAVAIHKKILRFDPGNMSAHWSLAELRATQGLVGEGAGHALQFLAPSERLGSEFRDAFLKRCAKLLGVYPTEPAVLSRLAEVFRFWALPLEAARVCLLQACLQRAAGRGERAEHEVAALLAEFPDLADTPEHARWQGRGPEDADGGSAPGGYADHNAIDLGSPAPPLAAGPPPAGGAVRAVTAPAGSPEGHDAGSLAQSLGLVDFGSPAPGATPDGGFPLDRLATDAPAPEGIVQSGRASLFGGDEPAAPPAAPEPAADGSLEILVDETPSFADLSREPAADGPPAPEAAPVDLLAEILAESAADAGAAEARQLDTIVNEIGAQVGGGEAKDPAAQYDMGLVYLEMELLQQAEECFEAASDSPAHALRSFEMWGIVLMRQGRYEEAIDVMGRGLRTPGTQATDLLGLLYHTGRAYEAAGRSGAAREYYERVFQTSPGFLDIEHRLEALVSV